MRIGTLKKTGKYVLCFFGVIIMVTAVFLMSCLLINRKEIKTLKGFQKESPANMYSMTYYSDYFLDDYLVRGSTGSRELEAFFKEKLLYGLEAHMEEADKNCSAFVCRNDKGEVLFCRNFDAAFSPVVMLQTSPTEGYQSISASNLAELGYDKSNLPVPEDLKFCNINLLATPYLITDGMNEHGLAMALLSTGTYEAPEIEGAPTLDQCTVIRMVLDKAKTIDEAIEMMQKYNYNFGKWAIHFMLADADGRAVVVEFHDEELVTIETPIVTNFNLYDINHAGRGKDRYDTIEETVEESNGVLQEKEVLELLEKTGMRGMKQYSVIYNLTTKEVTAFTSGDCSVTASFYLK